jgi:CheY-like chemotaxis protein
VQQGKDIIGAMPLELLLLSRDPEVIRVFRPTLEKLSITVEVCRGARSGSEILSSERFDAIIVDCDDLQDGLQVLEAIRTGSSNKNAVAFAIVNGTTTQKAFQMGANFVLQKPVSQVSAMRCLSTAMNSMTSERRRYFRHPVELPAVISFSQSADLKATMTNLSDGGMAIYFRGNFPKGGITRISFQLNGMAGTLECKGQIAWMDGAGRAGIRFTEMPKFQRQQLQEWLAQKAVGEESRG